MTPAVGQTRSAADFLPERRSLPALREAARGCRGCHLYRDATQTVFGEGAAGAQVMFVGEQPGDREDVEGRPFVGPAGKLFDRALEDAGIDRAAVYVTNAVKHFKWMPRGKRRIHKTPGAEEIRACRPWLDAEIEQVGPKVVVCLVATAAKALLGPTFRVTQQRGEIIDIEIGPLVTATIHPSAILRITDEEERRTAVEAFVGDLRRAAEVLSASG